VSLQGPHRYLAPPGDPPESLFRFTDCSHDELGRYTVRGELQPGTCPICGPMPQRAEDDALARREIEARAVRRRRSLYPWLRI
jgi:hypothetical protein